jgi:hypothetical protein
MASADLKVMTDGTAAAGHARCSRPGGDDLGTPHHPVQEPADVHRFDFIGAHENDYRVVVIATGQ